MTKELLRYVDLHMHTRYSDGIFVEPESLVRLNALNGISLMAVTDHDNDQGYTLAAREAKSYGMTVIPGAEITTPNYHLLALNFNPNTMDMICFLAHSKGLQYEKSSTRIRKLQEHGMPLDMSIVQKYNPDARLGKYNVFISALLDPESRKFIDTETPGMDFYNRFQYYMGNDGIVGDLDDVGVSEEEAIQEVHKAGGIIGLAHPPKDIKSISKLDRLRDLGIDFLEVQPNQRDRTYEVIDYDFIEGYAKANDLAISYGSDYHGATFNRGLLNQGENVLTSSLEELLNQGFIRISENQFAF